MFAFIDIECFIDNDGELIIKEICVINSTNWLNPIYMLYKPPYQWNRLNEKAKRTNKYIMRNVHKILWCEGDYKFNRKYLLEKISNVYNLKETMFFVFGNEKYNFLKKLLPELRLNLYNASINKLQHIPNNINCIRHHHRYHCAYLKCLALHVDFISQI